MLLNCVTFFPLETSKGDGMIILLFFHTMKVNGEQKKKKKIETPQKHQNCCSYNFQIFRSHLIAQRKDKKEM